MTIPSKAEFLLKQLEMCEQQVLLSPVSFLEASTLIPHNGGGALELWCPWQTPSVHWPSCQPPAQPINTPLPVLLSKCSGSQFHFPISVLSPIRLNTLCSLLTLTLVLLGDILMLYSGPAFYFQRILNLFKIKIIISCSPPDLNVHFWQGPGIEAMCPLI